MENLLYPWLLYYTFPQTSNIDKTVVYMQIPL